MYKKNMQKCNLINSRYIMFRYNMFNLEGAAGRQEILDFYLMYSF